jgi:hypothetical protein
MSGKTKKPQITPEQHAVFEDVLKALEERSAKMERSAWIVKEPVSSDPLLAEDTMNKTVDKVAHEPVLPDGIVNEP